MITHPDIAAKAALGAYHERVEQAHVHHIINRANSERTRAHVEATGHGTTTRTTRLTRSIRRLLRTDRRPTVFGSGSNPGALNPPPMTATPS